MSIRRALPIGTVGDTMWTGLPFLYVQFCGAPPPDRRAAQVSPPVPVAAPVPPVPAVLTPAPAPPPPCRHPDLGPARGYNVYTLGDFVGQHSNVGGRIAVGGRLFVDGYALGSTLPLGTASAVTVGGNAEIVNSRVHGGPIQVRGSCSTRSVGLPAEGLVCNDPNAPAPARAAATLTEIARVLSAAPLRACTVSSTEWGAVRIRTSGPFAACRLDLDQISDQFGPSVYNGWINQLTLEAGADATVVIDVIGDPAVFGKTGGYELVGGISSDRVLWNFADAPRLTLSGIGLPGTVFAPATHVRFDNGTIDGQLVAASFVGTGQFRDTPFAGNLCHAEPRP